MTILMTMNCFVRWQSTFTAQAFKGGCKSLRSSLFRIEYVYGLPDQLLARVSIHPAGRWVAVNNSPYLRRIMGVKQENRVW
jgi:hypothetical protein